MELIAAHIPDVVAFCCFLVCWIGYTWFADHLPRERGNIMVAMHDLRVQWMERMLRRDVRIGDINVIGFVIRSGILFVTTSVFILAGLVTIMGALDKARGVVSELDFAVSASREMWEIKLLVLILIFIYAFFKFVWSVRQLNFSLMLMGAAPNHDEPEAPDWSTFPRRAGRLITLAVDSFNRGVRAYYFGLAALGWFVHPWVFAGASVWVVLVIYRREFRSNTLRTLTHEHGDPFHPPEDSSSQGKPSA